MSRRSGSPSLLLAIALSIFLPRGGLAHEWEESYSDGGAPADTPNYDVDVEVDVNGSSAVTVDSFQETLAPYGEWTVNGSYGNVFRPRVVAGWRPYFDGRWEWTDEGWLWVSDEPWGWATYHYGRWGYDGGGWFWVPGYQWAPAWVSWRYSGDVVGWAPLAPGLSVYVTSYPFVASWWTFVPTGRFCGHPVRSIAYAPGHARQWYYATHPAPARPGSHAMHPGRPAPAPAWGGPTPRIVEERMGRSMTPVRLVPAPAPGRPDRNRPGEVAIFRPEIRFGGHPGIAPGFSREPPAGRTERFGPSGSRPALPAPPAAAPHRGSGGFAPAPAAPAPHGGAGRGFVPAPAAPHAPSGGGHPGGGGHPAPAPHHR